MNCDWILHNGVMYRPVTKEEYTVAIQFIIEENKKLEIENETLRKENHRLTEAICGDDNLIQLEKSAR